MSDAIREMDATGQAELVSSGEVSPRELVEIAVNRAKEVNPEVNAIIAPLYDEALTASEGELPDGPFRGVPFIFKDLGAGLQGQPFHMGNRLLKERDFRVPFDTTLGAHALTTSRGSTTTRVLQRYREIALQDLGRTQDHHIETLAQHLLDQARAFDVETVPVRDVGMVLGAKADRDRPSAFLAARLDLAQRLYEQGRIKAILVSGDGMARSNHETDVMRDYLVERGVPAEKIVQDPAGFDTYDSCVRARQIFGVSKAIVVSQTFHLPRALFTCDRLGLDVVAVGADTWGVEVVPFESKNLFEVHQILLAMNGTYILENMDTAELAKDKAYEFLFVLGQPRFKGGVQSMINPVAIR